MDAKFSLPGKHGAKSMSNKQQIQMAENKTKPTSASVEDFINGIPDEQKRKDSFVILEMIEAVLKMGHFAR
jgi:hypothetical protein